jgi:serine/threonine protein kinase
MSESVLKKFGKYFLLDRIGEGGMADIFRARMASLDANGRLIVIKRIQAAYSNNEEFLQMFKAEVQVTMRFTHPNIVQLYESGEEGGQQFIAMELVDGRNARQLLSKVSQKKERIPIAAACFITEQTGAGLHYAHTFKDRITGEPLNLVHRDVSPQNIIVSYDGNIKVIDFGIAKATTSGEATRAGVIKGKLSYLSPEQVLGDVLDARSDVFALGIVIWELLTGKRLFVAEGDNEFQVLKMIESCNTFVKVPSTYNPEVPPELDAIVMKALQRDVKKRYQSAEEMARALRKLLAVQFSDFGPSDLSNFIKKLFHEMIVEDRKQLQSVNGRAEELIALGNSIVPSSIANDEPATLMPGSDSHAKDQTRVTDLGNKFDKSQITSADRLELAGQPQKQMKVPAARPGATPSVAQAFARKTNTNISRPVPVEQTSVGSSAFAKVIVFLAVVSAGGYFAYRQYLAPNAEDAHSGISQTQSAPVTGQAPSKMAQLKLHLFPDGDLSHTRVTVNSFPYDLNRGTGSVSMGDLVALVIERPGFVTFRKEFTIKEADLADSHDYNLDVKLEPMVYGTFTLSTQPEVADVTIMSLDQGAGESSQKPVILKTPIYQEKLPVGHYKVTVKNDLLNVEKVFQIEIKEGDRIVKNSIPLEPTRLPANH